MSDAPETIWASTGLYYDYATDWSEGEWLARGPHGVEYRRVDLPPTLEHAMELPEIKALVETLGRISDLTSHNMGMSARDEMCVHREANAALAALGAK